MVNIELLRAGEFAVRENGTYAPLSGEAWIYALEMTLLGIGMIFAVLGVLWGVLAIFKLIFAKPASKPKTKTKVEEAPKAIETPKIETTLTPVAASADDAALVAILTAAIVAYESENGNDVDPSSFRVVSFRRANGGRAWNSK